MEEEEEGRVVERGTEGVGAGEIEGAGVEEEEGSLTSWMSMAPMLAVNPFESLGLSSSLSPSFMLTSSEEEWDSLSFFLSWGVVVVEGVEGVVSMGVVWSSGVEITGVGLGGGVMVLYTFLMASTRERICSILVANAFLRGLTISDCPLISSSASSLAVSSCSSMSTFRGMCPT